jgi:hypothetical protein
MPLPPPLKRPPPYLALQFPSMPRATASAAVLRRLHPPPPSPIPRKACTPSSPSRHPFPIKSYSSVSSIFVHGSAAWLRWHAGIDDELGISFPAHIKPPLPKDCNTSFQAARSILTVLQKLLEISSALTERVALVPMTMT